jgi:hypothetical protein
MTIDVSHIEWEIDKLIKTSCFPMNKLFCAARCGPCFKRNRS